MDINGNELKKSFSVNNVLVVSCFDEYYLQKDGQVILENLNNVRKYSETVLIVSDANTNKLKLYNTATLSFTNKNEYDEISRPINEADTNRQSSEIGYSSSNETDTTTEPKAISEDFSLSLASASGLWGAISNYGYEILPTRYKILFTYKGKLAGIIGDIVKLTKISCPITIPIKASHYDTKRKSYIFRIHGSNINIFVAKRCCNNYFPQYGSYTINVYAVNILKGGHVILAQLTPPKHREYRYETFKIGQEVTTTIKEVSELGIRLTKSKILLHHSQLGKYPTWKDMHAGDAIIIKKIGFDRIHHKDIWDIIEKRQ